MSMNKQVRFEPKTTITYNELIKNPEVNSEQNGDEDNEEFKCKNKLIDSMWEKLVLYYLSRLKGLCDWRRHSHRKRASYRRKNKYIDNIDSQESVFSEEDIIKRITEQSIKDCIKCNNSKFSDVGSFMAAGYEEGKQEAAKIVIRSLKYGLLTGILKKDGSVYRLRQKFTANAKSKTPKCKFSCKTRRKQRRSRLGHIMKLRTRRNARPTRQITRQCRNYTRKGTKDESKNYTTEHKKQNESRNYTKKPTKQDESYDKPTKEDLPEITSLKRTKQDESYDEPTKEDLPEIMSVKRTKQDESYDNPTKDLPEIMSIKEKKSSDLNISRCVSSSSSASTSSVKKKADPSAKRKRSREVLKRPVIRRPQRKKRGRSQTKSPTPTRSSSRESVKSYRPRKLNKFKSTFKKYKTPKPRRRGSVLSRVSSVSICTQCRQKRKREFSLSDTSSNVKRVKRSISSDK